MGAAAGVVTLSGGTLDNTSGSSVTLTNNNPQTWTNAMTVAFTGTNALNLGTGAVTLGTDSTAGSFTLTNNSVLAGTSLTVGGTISAIAGGTAGGKTLTVAGVGSTALTGNITKGSATSITITDTSSGTLTLSGTSTIVTLNVNGGSGSIIDIGAGSLTLSNAGSTTLTSTTGGTINGTGSITLSGTTGTAGDNSVATGKTLTINAKLVGNTDFEVYNTSGTFVLTNAGNSFNNLLFSAGGTVSVPSLGSSGSASTVGKGAINFNAATDTLIYTGTGETTNHSLNLQAATNVVLDQSGTGALKYTTLTVPTAAAHTLTLQGSTAGSGEISAVIPDNTSFATSVAKLGTGTWTLSGMNTYTGTTTIDQGTLAMTANQTLGALTFGAAAGSTNFGNLDLSTANGTFTNLLVRTSNATANTIAVGSGKTLTVNGATGLTVGVDLGTTTTPTTALTVSGSGSLVVANAAANVTVGLAQAAATSTNTGVLDLSGLASVTLGNATTAINAVRVGFGQTTTGSLLLSNTANLVTAATVVVGDSQGLNNAGTQSLTLGTGTNVFAVDTISVGQSKANGTFKFASQTAGSAGSVTIAGKTGATTNINVGSRSGTTGTASAPSGTFDLRGHTAAVTAGTVTIGLENGNGTGSYTGVLSFDTGTFTATTVSLAALSNTGSTGGATGTLNIGGGTFTAGTIGMAAKSGTGTGTATGAINVSGGDLVVNTAFVLASQAGTASTVATNGTLAITGTGVVDANVDITDGGGTATSILTLNGGTLDLHSHNIGGATAIDTLNFQSGTLQNVAQINNGANLVKTTAGALTLAGSNGYTGATNVQNGTVNFSTVGAGATAQGLGKGTTVNLGVAATSSGILNYTGAAATFDKNINVLGNGLDTIQNGGTGLLTLSGSIVKNGTHLNVAAGTNGVLVTGVISGTAVNSDLILTTGVTTLINANTYNGLTVINSGATLQLGDGTTGHDGTISSSTGITDNGTLIYNRFGTPSSSVPISGSGVVVKLGAGTQTLTASNSYTGATTIVGGNLVATTLANGGSNSSIGASTNAAANLVFDGGRLSYTGAGVSTDRLFTLTANGGTISADGTGTVAFTNTGAIAMSGTGNRTLSLNGTNAGSLAAVVADPTGGATTLNKIGTSTWTISGANTYSGPTTVQNGTLKLGSSLALPTNTTLALGTPTVGGILDLAGFSATLSSLTADATTGAANQVISSVGGGTLNLAYSGTPTDTFNGQLGGGGSGNGFAFNHTGTGTVALTQANTYTGGTTITGGGTLLVSNSTGNATGTGAVTVGTSSAASGTLTGTGTVATVITNAGGTVSPGLGTNSVAGLTVSGVGTPVSGTTFTGGAVDFSAGGNFNVNLSGGSSSFSQLSVPNGTVNLGTSGTTGQAALTLTGDYTGATNQTFNVITTGSNVAGTFTYGGVNLPEHGTFYYPGGNTTYEIFYNDSGPGVVITAAVPEPASVTLIGGLGLGVAGWVRRRRNKKADAGLAA